MIVRDPIAREEALEAIVEIISRGQLDIAYGWWFEIPPLTLTPPEKNSHVAWRMNHVTL